ncbi:MAG TPA: 4-(cytidine 5'-diphospho)-2-C-methyl-D-erythritol kinase [Acidobacteriaceae bacterium]|nr:4-(cytidine 5'-diphospho)-2-C-methyl-D-erythritol kinase [Acidobacteriaceae bacterium]
MNTLPRVFPHRAAAIYNRCSMMTRVRSHAKINLGLAIGPARRDGYHALATIYQTLAIHDVVEVTASRLADGAASQIVITCNDARVPCDDRNTCWKMVDIALQRLEVSARVAIHIEKKLPVRGGLGAGSANAAAALIGLEKELGIALSGGDRLAIAAETGSDVPLFLIGGTVLGVGRGEEVYPLPDLPQTSCVIAVPDVGISTPQAFEDWDRLQAAPDPDSRLSPEISRHKLTIDPASDRLKQLGRMWAAALAAPQELHANATGVFQAKDRARNLLLELVRTGIENDFETVVFTQYPSLCDILDTLKNGSQAAGPAIYAALSGSGSALFGLYETAAESCAVLKRLVAQGIPAYETTTVSRDLYWRDIFDA